MTQLQPPPVTMSLYRRSNFGRARTGYSFAHIEGRELMIGETHLSLEWDGNSSPKGRVAAKKKKKQTKTEREQKRASNLCRESWGIEHELHQYMTFAPR